MPSPTSHRGERVRSLRRPAGRIDIPPLAAEDIQARHSLRVPQPNSLVPGRAQDHLLLPGRAPLNTRHLRQNNNNHSKQTNMLKIRYCNVFTASECHSILKTNKQTNKLSSGEIQPQTQQTNSIHKYILLCIVLPYIFQCIFMT